MARFAEDNVNTSTPNMRNPLPWPRQRNGNLRYKQEMQLLRHKLKPSLLKVSVTRGQDVVLEVQTPSRPGLTFYLSTDVKYPFTTPEALVVQNDQEVPIFSQTLEHWSVNNALYQVCLDATPVPQGRATMPNWALAAKALPIFLVFLAVFFALVLLKQPPKPADNEAVSPVTELASVIGSINVTALVASSNPTTTYKLQYTTLQTLAEYQTALNANKLNISQATTNRLLLLSKAVNEKATLRAINQKTGRVRDIPLPGKNSAYPLNIYDTNCKSHDICQFLLVSADGQTELSDAPVINGFNIDAFYVFTLEVNSRTGK